jgi:hypothetical protein
VIQASARSGFAGTANKVSRNTLRVKHNPPDRVCFTKKEWELVQRLNTPAKVQRFFSSLPYNWERQGGTMRSFRELLKHKEVHCLEAAVGAAVILEQHGYPPLLLDLESVDLLDHVRVILGCTGGSRCFDRCAIWRGVISILTSISQGV